MIVENLLSAPSFVPTNQSNVTLLSKIEPPPTLSAVSSFAVIFTSGVLLPSHDTLTVVTTLPFASDMATFCCTILNSSLYDEHASVYLPHSSGLPSASG